MSSFTVAYFLYKSFRFAFFYLLIALVWLCLENRLDLVHQIVTFDIFFIKIPHRKIICYIFWRDSWSNLTFKVTYRTYMGLLILPSNIILFYYDTISRNFPLAIIATILIANVLTIFNKNYQNIIFGKLFYFILYLCAFEIAPYYFMYYWFTKGLLRKR
jgi:hypothetical protein